MAGGIFGDGQRGGIFGARIDPRLLAKKRIADAFAAAEGMQEPSRALYEAKHRRAQEGQPVEPGFWSDVASLGPRAVGGAQKMWQMAPAAAEALYNDPLGTVNRAGMAGQAATDAIVQGMAKPFTQFGGPNVDPVKQGADLGLAAMGMSSVVPAEVNELRMGIKAYHGSPHDFERFDSSKIGTGEGAQAYGHGIYAAESPSVAETYRTAGPAGNMPAPTYEAPSDVLTRHAEEFGKLSVSSPLLVKGFGALDVEGRRSVVPMMRGLLQDPQISKAVVRLLPVDVMDMLGGKQGASEVLRHNPSMLVDLLPANADHAVAGGVQAVDVLAPYVAFATAKRPLMGANSTALLEEGLAARSANKGDLHLRSEIPYPSKRGKMYQVDIAADPEHFLDWDKPLSEQSPQVREAVNAATPNDDFGRMFKSGGNDPKGSRIAEFMADAHGSGNQTRADRIAATAALREAGIPGIKYLDQGSRVSDAAQKIIENYGSREKALEIAEQRLKSASLGDIRHWQGIVDELKKSESRNFVVFDDKLISILKKYGLPISAAGLAALSQLHPQEAQAAQQKGKR